MSNHVLYDSYDIFLLEKRMLVTFFQLDLGLCPDITIHFFPHLTILNTQKLSVLSDVNGYGTGIVFLFIG